MTEPKRKEDPDDRGDRGGRQRVPPVEDPIRDERPRELPPRDPDRPDDPELPNEDQKRELSWTRNLMRSLHAPIARFPAKPATW